MLEDTSASHQVAAQNCRDPAHWKSLESLGEVFLGPRIGAIISKLVFQNAGQPPANNPSLSRLQETFNPGSRRMVVRKKCNLFQEARNAIVNGNVLNMSCDFLAECLLFGTNRVVLSSCICNLEMGEMENIHHGATHDAHVHSD